MADQSPFVAISRSFNSNINALRVFSERIGQLADEHDRTIAEQMAHNICGILGITEYQITFEEAPQVPEELPGEEESAELKAKLKEILVSALEGNPNRARRLFRLSKNFANSWVLQGQILRRAALTILVSYYEALLADLLETFYHIYPQSLPQEGHSLTLAEIKALGSIEEAEKQIIAREVESVMRKNFDEQIKYFSQRLKVNLDSILPYEPKVKEIVLRRNVIVHNDSIINRIYLNSVDQGLITEEVKEGERIHVSSGYLQKAIDSVLIIGFALVNLCWLKWGKHDIKALDGNLTELTYENLVEGRRELVVELANFASGLGGVGDATKKIVLINKAIALKELGQKEDMDKCLEDIDWSGSALVFRVALLVLRDQHEEFYGLLPNALAAREIDKDALEDWPLFRSIRDSSEFQAVLGKLDEKAPAISSQTTDRT